MEEVRILKNTIYTVVVCMNQNQNQNQPTPIPPQNNMATRTLTGNKENTNVIHPEEVGIGMAIKDRATTIRRLPTQAHRGGATPIPPPVHRTQRTPQNTMATIA